MANNNSNFEIPIPLIVIAYVFCWPVGIILTVLRAISQSDKKNNYSQYNGKQNPYYQWQTQNQQKQNQQAPNYKYTYNYDYSAQQKNAQANNFKGKKRKSSAGYSVSTTFAILSAIILGFLTLALVIDFSFSVLPAFAVFALITGSLFTLSGLFKKRDIRFARIKSIIGNRSSINLTKIATASNESLKRIRKDVQKMIDNGDFGDLAYIDLGTNNFMKTPDAVPDEPEQFDYRTVYGNVFDKKAKKETKEETPQPAVESEEISTSTDRENFDTILNKIRRLNNEILDVDVSERIFKIEDHTKNIFDYVTDHQEAMPQIRTFMNYYLPTTLKLLESYSRIERVGVAGENMKKSKQNIENILDLLVVGFEQQIDQLFKNECIDISSDISVIETMMQKDGLNGKSDFSKMYDMFTQDVVKKTDGVTEEVCDKVSDTFTDSAGGAAATQEDNDNN